MRPSLTTANAQPAGPRLDALGRDRVVVERDLDPAVARAHGRVVVLAPGGRQTGQEREGDEQAATGH